jgi:hypothetical protein
MTTDLEVITQCAYANDLKNLGAGADEDRRERRERSRGLGKAQGGR